MSTARASELEAVAEGIRKSHPLFGPDKRGDYLTSTAVCHGGDSPDKLSFGPNGIHCFTRGSDCVGTTWNRLREAAGLPARATVAQRPPTLPIATYFHANSGNPKRVYRLDCPGIGCAFPIRNNRGRSIPCNGAAIDPKKGRGKHIWQDSGRIDNYLLLLWKPLSGDEGSVVIVEGEKAAAAVRDAGFVAASYIGGSKNVGKAVYTPVEGRDVVVWPDASTGGRATAASAAKLAREAGAASVRIVVAPGEDDSDAADIEPDEIRERIEQASEWVEEAGEAEEQIPETSSHRLAAEFAVDELGGEYRYDPNIEVFHRWDGRRWHEMPSPRGLIDEIAERRYQMAADAASRGNRAVADILSDRREWERSVGRQYSEFISHLRMCISRPVPVPAAHELATPQGVVDLRTGSISPHDPRIHDTLAVTRGCYRPQHADELRAILWQRLRRNISEGDFGELMRALGVAIARRARDYTSIIWLYGASGGGKGFTAHLIRRALGEHGKGVSAGLLARRTGDIDADLADLLEADPVVIVTHEVEEVGIGRLNAMTGGDEMSARRPHGKTIRRALTGMMMVTSVTAPTMPADSGLRRRICVIHFPQSYTGANRQRDVTDDEMDAIVTIGVLEAMNVGSFDWTPPRGNIEAKKEFISLADPIAAWLDELSAEKFNGMPVSEALATFNEQSEEEVTSRKFGLRVNAHPGWRVKRSFKNGRTVRHLDYIGNQML